MYIIVKNQHLTKACVIQSIFSHVNRFIITAKIKACGVIIMA
jgi:hypothetical protein